MSNRTENKVLFIEQFEQEQKLQILCQHILDKNEFKGKLH